MAARPLPQSLSPPYPPNIAHHNGTLRWHPAMAAHLLPQSWSSPYPPNIAHHNGTLRWHHVHSPKDSTLQWHPEMGPSNGNTSTAPCNGTLVPRPIRQSGSSPSPPIGSKNPYSYPYLGNKTRHFWEHCQHFVPNSSSIRIPWKVSLISVQAADDRTESADADVQRERERQRERVLEVLWHLPQLPHCSCLPLVSEAVQFHACKHEYILVSILGCMSWILSLVSCTAFSKSSFSVNGQGVFVVLFAFSFIFVFTFNPFQPYFFINTTCVRRFRCICFIHHLVSTITIVLWAFLWLYPTGTLHAARQLLNSSVACMLIVSLYDTWRTQLPFFSTLSRLPRKKSFHMQVTAAPSRAGSRKPLPSFLACDI